MLTVVLAVGAVFAQSSNPNAFLRESGDSNTPADSKIIQIEDKYEELHPSAKSVNIMLEYTPLTGEVRFIYVCSQAGFSQDEAMNTAITVFDEFAYQNKYRIYSYVTKDKVSYNKDERGIKQATYTSEVRFRR